MAGMPPRRAAGTAAGASAVVPAVAGAEVSSAAAGLREQRRLRRAQMSREHVLNVAERLFGDQGYQATSLEQVAAGSEFSVGAVYKLFASKKELLAAVLTRRHVEMDVAVRDIVAAGLSGLDELLALCSYYLDYFELHPPFGRLTLRVYTLGLESIPDFAEYNDSFREGNELFIAPIRRGQLEGSIRDIDAPWLATQVQGMIMFDNSMRNGPLARQVGIEELLSLVRRAVAVEPVSKRAKVASRTR
jgi:AcrR family transcriptional regulator